LLNETVKKWKTKWLDQFGDLNLLHLKDLSIVDNNFLAENLFTS
jgi:hypothetical protein